MCVWEIEAFLQLQQCGFIFYIGRYYITKVFYWFYSDNILFFKQVIYSTNIYKSTAQISKIAPFIHHHLLSFTTQAKTKEDSPLSPTPPQEHIKVIGNDSIQMNYLTATFQKNIQFRT